MIDKDAIKELTKFNAINAALAAMPPPVASGSIALPNDFSVTDLEKYLPYRRRARGSMKTSVVEDFAAYAGAHKEEGATCFVDQDRMAATAVLNLGTPSAPGHGDCLAVYAPKTTAAFAAMMKVANGSQMAQRNVAEFLEDWPAEVECLSETGVLAPTKAIAAVRNITIENLRRAGAAEQQLSAERSTFESVSASSADPLPLFIYFKCMPYVGLQQRLFVLRLGIVTSDKPAITLRIVTAEKHQEEMAAEVAAMVRQAMDGSLPVVIGTYSATS